MSNIEEAKAHCRFVGEGIDRDVAEGRDLGERFEGGTLTDRLKVSTSAALRAVVATGSIYFEADVKFRQSGDAVEELGE